MSASILMARPKFSYPRPAISVISVTALPAGPQHVQNLLAVSQPFSQQSSEYRVVTWEMVIY